MTVSQMIDRLMALRFAGQGDSLEAVFLRDQVREASDRAFRRTIALDFQRADGAFPDWIERRRTKLGPPWDPEP